jgi:tRNA pseudouridine55 synthase
VEVERPPRPVTVYSFDVRPGDEPGVLVAAVECSAGTYVRTLAADLGSLLGGGAHLRNLRRTHVGDLTLADAAPPEECVLRPVDTAVRTLPRVEVPDEVAALVANGRVLDAWAGDGPWAVHRPDGALVAVYERFRGDQAKPAVVLPVPPR